MYWYEGTAVDWWLVNNVKLYMSENVFLVSSKGFNVIGKGDVGVKE